MLYRNLLTINRYDQVSVSKPHGYSSHPARYSFIYSALKRLLQAIDSNRKIAARQKHC